MEFLIFIAFFLGLIFSALFKIELRISKKKDYREKTKELEKEIEELHRLQQELVIKINDETEEPVKESQYEYDPTELAPHGFSFEYGVPRKLKDEGGK